MRAWPASPRRRRSTCARSPISLSRDSTKKSWPSSRASWIRSPSIARLDKSYDTPATERRDAADRPHAVLLQIEPFRLRARENLAKTLRGVPRCASRGLQKGYGCNRDYVGREIFFLRQPGVRALAWRCPRRASDYG